MSMGSTRAAPRSRRAWLALLVVLAAASVLTGAPSGRGASELGKVTGGTVVAWGCGRGLDFGQCSVPSGLTGVTAIAAGEYQSLALKRDGTVVAWGCSANDSGQCNVPSGLDGVTAVAAGGSHSLALKRDGSVVAWGCDGADFGQCAVPNGLSGVRAIAAGLSHSLALKRDGTVVAWGCGGGGVGQCNVPDGLSSVIAIAAGRYDSLALRANGTVVAWGCGPGGFSGQCNIPSELSDVTAVSAGAAHSLALKRDATAVAWGCANDDFGQCGVPSGLSNVTAISAGWYHSLVLKRDGTVVAWGCGDPSRGVNDGQCDVPSGLSGVTAIAGGYFHSLALVERRNRPPDCSKVAASPDTFAFQGPDRLSPVTLAGATDPEGGPLVYRVERVTQDEPVVGQADRSWPDGLFVPGRPSSRLLVRAEANPRLNGRVYRIAYDVSDRDGGKCSGVAKVSVPRKQGTPAVDDGDTASWSSLTGAPVR